MRWLARDAQKHDTLFFHYSGHGKLVKDKNGDEIDGYDQALVPLDHRTAGTIIDDDIHDAMVKPLPIGCKLTVLCDSCHSGSILDVPYAYSSRGRLKDSPVTHKWHEYKSSTADVVSWSSCKDCQTSADIHKHGFPTGAMSYAFITALDRNPQPSYRELLRSTRALTKEYSQKPQLSIFRMA
ncbi:peptidase C14, caspase domain-containing protein [Trametes meyenii]|nr:peptidase C14, caspase domain-containing protein [Trametes meyenii]